MSSGTLPERASLEYLKKLAKDRLRELRRTDPETRLAAAQLVVARDHGFPSWRALRAEVDRRRAPRLDVYFAACGAGDVDALRELLDRDETLVRERDSDGATGLHLAVHSPAAVRLLLDHGADPNARDTGDNALPLHFAAGAGQLDSVRALLDAGSDPRGVGDAHELEAIGWATVFGAAHREVVDLLVDRGAPHHVFSAVALGDLGLLRRLVAADPGAVGRRLSPTEQRQTTLHYAIAPPDGLTGGAFRTGDHYRTVAALIELGADLEARDAAGRTPLEVAMSRGDSEAMRLLHAAGAREPQAATEHPEAAAPPSAALAASVSGLTPMLGVTDLATTLAWYRAVGFDLRASHGEGDRLDWASMVLGTAEVMFVPAADPGHRAGGVTLWLRTDRIDELYALLKRRQLARAGTVLAGREPADPEVPFEADLHTTFYGQREFAVRDPDGVTVYFAQPT